MLLEPLDGQRGEVTFDEALRLPELCALDAVLLVQAGGKQVCVGVDIVPEDGEGLAGKALVDGRLHAAHGRKDGEQTLLLKAVRSVGSVRSREDEHANQDRNQDRNQGRGNGGPSAGGHGSMLAHRLTSRRRAGPSRGGAGGEPARFSRRVASPAVSATSASVLIIHPEVADALADGKAVVALESTISSTLGLPVPFNAEVLARCATAIRAGGSVPALTAVIDGVARVGVDPTDYERVLHGTRKCAERDLPVAIAQRWDVGVTTVSASIALAALAGVAVFATGGIGGVHRDDHLSGDVSADLHALARHPVVTVTAGAKAFLDLAKTLELFDTLSVPVLGFGTDEFPAFYSRSSGLPVPHRVDDAAGVAAVYRARLALGLPGGVVVANPIPASAEIPVAEIEPVIEQALRDAAASGVRSAALTPFVLGRIGAATAGRSVPANLALAENNARVAAAIAVAIAASR